MTDQQMKTLSSSRKLVESIALSLTMSQLSIQLLQDRVKALSSLLDSLGTQLQEELKELTPVNFVEADESGYEW